MTRETHAKSRKHELEQVDGVGPVVREVLVNGGVETLADLAAASVSDIIAIFEPVSRRKIPAPLRTEERIGKMILDAQELERSAGSPVAKATATAESSAASSRQGWQTYEEFALDFEYGDSDEGQRWRAVVLPQAGGELPEPRKWHAKNGGYVVKFEHQPGGDGQAAWRTIVEHSDTGVPTDITGWTPDRWWPWIAEKEVLLTRHPSAARRDEPTRSADEPPEAASQQTEANGQEPAVRISSFVVREKSPDMLVADITFEVSDTLLELEPLQCQIEVLTLDVENGLSTLVGFESKRLEPARRNYGSEIAFAKPALGLYQPHCVVLLASSGGHGAFKVDEIFEMIAKRPHAEPAVEAA